MPDKECTTSLLELAFAVGQLRANPTKPREYVGSMGEMLAGWECRKSGDDGKAFDGLQAAIDSAAKGKVGSDASGTQIDKIFSEYHSLLLAMGYLDLEQIDQPKRAPVPQVGFKDGTLQTSDFRLMSTGTGKKAFTDYRQVKVAKPAPVTTTATEEEDKPKPPEPPKLRQGRAVFMSACLSDPAKGASAGRMTLCSDEWKELSKKDITRFSKLAQDEFNAAMAVYEVAKAKFDAENPPPAGWGYNNEKKRRGASRWTPQNARNSILQ
jgi:hypothetical protein